MKRAAGCPPLRWAYLLLLLVAWQQVFADDPLQQANAAYDSQDFALAAKLFGPLAEQGEPSAQLRLGMLYQFGRGVPQDYATALTWYQKAAANGNAEAVSRASALQKRMKASQERQAQVAGQNLPEASAGGALLNVFGAVAAGYNQAQTTSAGFRAGAAQQHSPLNHGLSPQEANSLAGACTNLVAKANSYGVPNQLPEYYGAACTKNLIAKESPALLAATGKGSLAQAQQYVQSYAQSCSEDLRHAKALNSNAPPATQAPPGFHAVLAAISRQVMGQDQVTGSSVGAIYLDCAAVQE